MSHPCQSRTVEADHLDEPDSRWRGDGSGCVLYEKDHISGAVHLDCDHTVDAVRDLILPPDQFANVVAAAGIGDENPVVAYADTDLSGAARPWWALHLAGFSKWRFMMPHGRSGIPTRSDQLSVVDSVLVSVVDVASHQKCRI